MRPLVRAAIIFGILVVAVCAVYATLFVRSTQMRIDRLEEYINDRGDVRDSQYDETTDRLDDQQQQITRLQQQLCVADPASCDLP